MSHSTGCKQRSARTADIAMRNGGTLDGLTGLRAIAAAWVVVFHYRIVPFRMLDVTDVLGLIKAGYLAVDLFFILSGFVIWHVYAPEFERFRVRTFARFLCLRGARLYPVHLLGIALLACLLWLKPPWGGPALNPTDFTLGKLFLDLALIQCCASNAPIGWNDPSWSVSVGWFCYLVFPVLAVLAASTGRRGTLIGIIVLIAAIDGMCLMFFGDSMNRTMGAPALLRAAPEFMLGCLLRRLWGQIDLAKWPWTAIVVGIGALWLASLQTALPAGFLAIPLFVALILAGSASGCRIAGALGSRPMVAAGAASYSLYLMQVPVYRTLGALQRYLVPGHALRSAGIAAIYPSVLVTATILSNRLVENPARRWLRKQIDIRLPRLEAKDRPEWPRFVAHARSVQVRAR